jgi:hypothetical protein
MSLSLRVATIWEPELTTSTVESNATAFKLDEDLGAAGAAFPTILESSIFANSAIFSAPFARGCY